jgi:hypothetical protein
MAALLACPTKIFNETAPWSEEEIAVALARQLAIDLWRWHTGRVSAAELGWTLPAAAVHQPKQALEFTKVNLPRQSVPQGGTLLDAAADLKRSSLRMGAFHPKLLPQVQARHRGRRSLLATARIGAGDRENPRLTSTGSCLLREQTEPWQKATKQK